MTTFVREEEEADRLVLVLRGEVLPEGVGWCAGCDRPLFGEEAVAFDAWDRPVHLDCRARVPRVMGGRR